MPGRKSGESINEDGAAQKPAEKTKRSNDKDGIGVEDLTIPKSVVQRLAKGVLPPNTPIQSSALLAIQKSATVFVSYLASNANDRAVLAGKKTIQPHDVIEALTELEFASFVPRCEGELEKYDAAQRDKRIDYKRRREQAKLPEEGPKDKGKGRQIDEEDAKLSSDGEEVEGKGDDSADEQLKMEVDLQQRKRREGDEPSAAKRARRDAEDGDDDEDHEMDDFDDGEGVQDEEADEEEEPEESEEADADDTEDGESESISGEEVAVRSKNKSGRGGFGDVDDVEDVDESD